ncbi:hypothetical protein C6N75_18495 [Streptomyces solincola]|uniref:Uncharacterized protein n=1 Tax=Streptomyces solincola TaxID=2100817 RepID=A0A2S9PTP7_9ACTN|nr:hypothetical protein C6N75_18495 [Streptomyces solincola]
MRPAGRHATNITLGQYLVEMTNAALAAITAGEKAKDITQGAAKLAKALNTLAEELADAHHLDPRLIAQVQSLAEDVGRMEGLARTASTACDTAVVTAVQAAQQTGRTYQADLDAMADGGTAHASAATHHQ